MSGLFVKGSVSSDLGEGRTNNEDNYFLNGRTADYKYSENQNSTAFHGLSQNGVFAVFDGMGGSAKGEFASLCAASTLGKYTDSIINDTESSVNDYIEDTNKQICREAEKINRPIGSTMALLVIKDGKAKSYNLGDSCIYHISKGRVTRITHSHTVAEQLYRMRAITREEAERDIRRHRLTKHLGMKNTDNRNLAPYVSSTIKLLKNDTFVLCTDGISDSVNEREINSIVERFDGKCKKTADAIIEKAIRNGSRDNLTAMVLRITSNRSKSILSRFSLGGYLHLYQLLPVMLVSAAVLLLLILIIFCLK